LLIQKNDYICLNQIKYEYSIKYKLVVVLSKRKIREVILLSYLKIKYIKACQSRQAFFSLRHTELVSVSHQQEQK